jgi:two-component system invasion response regulator UvrY
MLRVLIVDDHAVVREGLRLILGQEFSEAVFAEAESAEEALQKVRQSAWDVVLLDIVMPGRSGLDIIVELQQLRSDTAILVLSMYGEEQYAERAFKLGAAGYLTKDKAPHELIQAIKKVTKGGRYVSEALGERLASHLGQGDQGKGHETLSAREFEVLRLIAIGNKPSAIAKTLHLSVKTVNSYRQRVLTKMRLKTTADLIKYAVQNKLVE